MSHFQSPHMAEFNGLIPRFLAAAPTINRFDVSQRVETDVGERAARHEYTARRRRRDRRRHRRAVGPARGGKLGASVLLIEGGPYGTTCARVGCMPSKLLIAAADAAHHVAGRPAPSASGYRTASRVDGPAVLERVRRERDRFVGFVLDERRGDPGRRNACAGTRASSARRRLQVDDHTRVEAKAVVVATGSSPSVPPALQGVRDHLLISDDVFELHDLPRVARRHRHRRHRSRARSGHAPSRRADHLLLALGAPRAAHRSGAAGRAPRRCSAPSSICSSPATRPSPASADGFHVRWTDAAGRQREARFDALLCATGRHPTSTRSTWRAPACATVPARRPAHACSSATCRSSSPATPARIVRCCTKPPTRG